MELASMAASANARLTLFCKNEKNHYCLKVKLFSASGGNNNQYNPIPRRHGGSGAMKMKRWCSMAESVEAIKGKKVNGVEIRGVEVEVEVEGEKRVHGCDLMGRFVEDKFVYAQTFIIRSYETGPDKAATMETLMNLLQETALNHVTCSGLAGNDFGATREMSLRKLIWVVTRVHVQVQRYSCWGDVVEIDTWVDAEGKNGMRRDWIIRDYHTREIITRATSTWVIMNKESRRLCKIPEQVREELIPFYFNRTAIPTHINHSDKIHKLTHETAERIRSGLAPRWNDMDANQHVNNVKYIGWILESVPINVLEEFDLTSMTLEYRRECRQSNLVESLTSTTQSQSQSYTKGQHIQYTHLLRMEANKADIVRATTQWNSKLKHN